MGPCCGTMASCTLAPPTPHGKATSSGDRSSTSATSTILRFLPSYQGIVLVGGIYIFFLAFGYYQESVYRIGDRTSGDTFRYPIFLVAALCLGNVITSLFILLVQGVTVDQSVSASNLKQKGSEVVSEGALTPQSPVERLNADQADRIHTQTGFVSRLFLDHNKFVLREIAWTAATYVLSMVCTNFALTRVNYPTQVLVKSAKSVPVILGGLIFFGKRYPAHDYVAVAVVTAALTIFNLTGGSSVKASQAHQTAFGFALLMGSLFCDSLTGPRQDRLLSRVRISPTHLMFITNVFGSILSLVACVALEGVAPFSFCFRYPEAFRNICLFCVSASLGQVFIFGSLTAFGSLYLTLITTTRKFFTVLLSVILFGHEISSLQWACVALVFLALTMQSVQSKLLREKTKEKSA